MNRFVLPMVLILVLAGCAPSQSSTVSSRPGSLDTAPSQPLESTSTSENKAGVGLTRVDEQGAVIVEITPLNLERTSDQIEFDVALDTHSIDLSMDLATLATISTDSGITVQASLWDAIPGGHHVSGKLIFPAQKDGRSILDGATRLTLTILNVDAPSRVFEWQLN